MSKMLRIAAGCGSSPIIRVPGALRRMANGAMGHRLAQAICRPKSGTKLGLIPAREEAHHHYARIHVAVARACNIQCNYCNRKYDCANESRPGVGSEKLTPEQAARKLLAVATRIPQLTVLGIAGPGDALANPRTTSRATDLRARARHSIRAQRPARPDQRRNWRPCRMLVKVR